MDNTSEPGKGSDPLEADFEQDLANQGLELEGRELPKPVKPEVPNKPEAPKPPEPPKEEKPKEEKPKVDDGKPDKPKVEPWRHAIATKREEQQKAKDEKIANLERENADLRSKPPQVPLKPEDKPKPDEVALTKEQRDFAEKYGFDPEDFARVFPNKEVVKEIVKNGLTPEQEALLNNIKSDTETRAIQQGYDTDFKSSVLPLIKAEYPTISDEKVEEIKSKIFERIQTDEYSMTPLATLYKGEDDFRGVVTVPKKTFDSGSKVPGTTGDKVYDFENVTEADMANPDFPFEKFSDYKASKEKGTKRS